VFIARAFLTLADITAGIRWAFGHTSAWTNYAPHIGKKYTPMDQRVMYTCPDCGSLYVTPLAAAECCNPAWDRGTD
jgi:hypothetical protein